MTEPERIVALIEEALEAKRAGRYFRMPPDLTPAEKSRIWAKVFEAIKEHDRARALEQLTPSQIKRLPPGPRPPEQYLPQNRSKQGPARRITRGARH